MATTTGTTLLGACRDVVTGAARCALQAADCVPKHITGTENILAGNYSDQAVIGEQWYASNTDIGSQEQCRCEDNTFVGACLVSLDDTTSSADKLVCAAHPDACLGSEIFIGANHQLFLQPEYRDLCTCQGRRNGGPKTAYGACLKTFKTTENNKDISAMNAFFCAYAPSDCDASLGDSFAWVEPRDVRHKLGQDCTCDQVHLGACLPPHSDDFQCAVTLDDCQIRNHYVSPLVLLIEEENTNRPKCRLCPASNDPSTTNGDVNIGFNQNDDGRDRWLGLAVAIASAVLVFIGLALALWKKQCSSSSANRVSKTASADDNQSGNTTARKDRLDVEQKAGEALEVEEEGHADGLFCDAVPKHEAEEELEENLAAVMA